MRGLPTLDQVAEIPVSLTLVAPPEFEDYNGHVNVSHHYALHMQACEAAMADLGMTVERIHAEGTSVFSADHRLTFLREIRIGDTVSVHVRWLGRTAKALHGVSIIANETTGLIASLCEFVEVSVDLGARRAAPFPDDIARAIDALVGEHAALTWAMPAARPLGLGR